ncbi:hypothetical protein ACQP1G_21200 [Nocardia sp. CA-107356]|uniref:hypothetical protein n=1 Tax=Nocardia sp. CA-107356 TaxID=3239972 RepID=UPI003D8CCAF7
MPFDVGIEDLVRVEFGAVAGHQVQLDAVGVGGEPGGHRLAGGDASDMSGWSPYTPGAEPGSVPGRPYYKAEAWRRFRLIDIAILDNSVFVKCAWDEPETSHLEYFAIVPVDRYTGLGASASDVAFIVRSHMRDLLAPLDALKSAPSNSTPGWCNSVSHTWLGPSFALVAQPMANHTPSVLDPS